MNASNLYASYDEDTLDIFAKMLPRFVLMSSQLHKVKEEIEMCVLYEKLDERSAISLMGKIHANYPAGIKNYKIKLIDKYYQHLESCKNAQLLFMFDTTEENIQQSLHFAKLHQILTISYNADLLADGVNISLYLGRKIIPFLNVSSINANGIEFDNTLLRVSKIYSADMKNEY